MNLYKTATAVTFHISITVQGWKRMRASGKSITMYAKRLTYMLRPKLILIKKHDDWLIDWLINWYLFIYLFIVVSLHVDSLSAIVMTTSSLHTINSRICRKVTVKMVYIDTGVIQDKLLLWSGLGNVYFATAHQWPLQTH